MKKIISCILSIMLFVTCFSSNGVNISAVGSETKSAIKKDDPLSSGYYSVLENDKFILYYRDSDANLAVYNKSTGYAWYSNPQTIDEASAGTKIRSQLAFRYYKNNAITVMDNYDFGIEDQNFPETSTDGNSFKVNYKVGDTAFTTDMLPAAIVKDSMEKNILSKLSDEDKAEVLERYALYSRSAMDAETLKVIEMNFPSIKKYDLYVFNTATPSYVAEKIYDIFLKAGYSVDDLDKYCNESEVTNNYVEKPFFNAEVVYTLTDNGLRVELDPEKVEYSNTYKPVSVEILPYFGASFKGNEGYMLVPDGSGAVIEFDNGKTGVNYYDKPVYEVDNISNEETSQGNIQLTSLPFFGMACENGSFIASVDNGYEVLSVSAEVSGSNSSFNRIAPAFTLFSSDIFTFSANKLDTYLKYAEEIFSDKISVEYMFTDDFSDYSTLARIYREHLKEIGVLKDNNPTASSMNISFIGTAEVTKSFLGMPYKYMDAYTTLEQVEEILGKISSRNTDIRLIDFVAGGSVQESVTSLKLQKSVGKIKDLSQLYDKTNTAYLSIFAQYKADADKSDSAISISQEIAYRLNYDLINLKKETSKYSLLLSSSLLEENCENIISQAKKNKVEAVNLKDIGFELNSDFRENAEHDRHFARIAAQNYMQNLSKNVKVSVDKGSIFALPYVSKIWDIPMDSSNYLIEDYSVPFYQMVISGNIAYTASAINEGSQTDYELLKCIEYGAEPQFTLTYTDLDNINYYREDYYGYNYENHIETINDFAEKYSRVSEATAGSAIVRHRNYGGEAAVTEYENGVKIYINYTDEVMAVEGNKVDPKAFAVIK